MNTFYVNYMTRNFYNLVRNEPGAVKNGKSMANAIWEAAKRAGSAEENRDGAANVLTERAAEPSTQYTNTGVKGTDWPETDRCPRAGGLNSLSLPDRTIIEAMTMEEYKEYIRDRILALPMHVSHMQDTVTITISDEGLAAMKRDADYEEWVLNDLRTGWAWENPWARYLGGAYSTIHYGAAKEECHAEMWNAGFRHGDGRGLFESMSGDEEEDDKKRKSEIVLKPDGTRYLVISEVIDGMKVTVMSIKLTDPDERMQDTPDMEDSAAGEALANDYSGQ